MIKKYPEYSVLRLEHSKLISNFVAQFEPYSDFNFVSLFSWNVDETTAVSMLNDNLVIIFPYYLTAQPTMSMLGTNNPKESINTLLKDSGSLKLVPEVVKDSCAPSTDFRFINDEANYDYIYKIEDHIGYKGNKLRIPRNEVNKFTKAYGPSVQVQRATINGSGKILQLIDVFNKWCIEREKIEDEVKSERQAIIRLLEHAQHFKIECYEVLIDGEIAGFSVNEVLGNNYATCHFQKCLLEYKGIDAYLTQAVSIQLSKMGCKLINWEQDLGIPGLRQLKRNYAPVRTLKKYLVV